MPFKAANPVRIAARVNRWHLGLGFVLLGVQFRFDALAAGPAGPVVVQGSAAVTTQGSQVNIHASDRAVINWQSFNIGRGESATFIQPSSSSVVWNRILDANPSQILGNLNANGYVVLQNPSGFVVGGDAKIAVQGLVMTTSPVRVPDLSSGGAWQFNAIPPTSKIVNYGRIQTGEGGAAYLIAHDVENHGSMVSPGGRIGLFAGQEVLVSERPDGRGLSARATLPAGTVDNDGHLSATAGAISIQARVVNQGGLIEANSIRENGGVIELVATESVQLGAGSIIQANGEAGAKSDGGKVSILSKGDFKDSPSSRISAGGGASGDGGQIEISASRMAGIQSVIEGRATAGHAGATLTIDPLDISLRSSGADAPVSGEVAASGGEDILTLNVNSFNDLISQNGLSRITLQAGRNIEVATLWNLPDSQVSGASLVLRAGRNISFNNGSGIAAGLNWNVDFSAGSEMASGDQRQAGQDGIYLKGNSFIQTLNGTVKLKAANDIIVNPGPPYAIGTGAAGNNGIRTLGGGSIEVEATFGDVNTGGNFNGYQFGLRNAPYYRVSPLLGGISTGAGGDVTIRAGGDVTSYLPVQNNYNNALSDGGAGAFGPQPGNVSITAGGKVSGHYVVANGTGAVTAEKGIGSPTAAGGFALSLVKGSWDVSAPHGSIFVQDIRNPNGVFNDQGGSVEASPGYHRFDYDSKARVTLKAGDAIEFTGAGAPHLPKSSPATPVPFLLPPTLEVTAGPGGFTLDTDIALFPSPDRTLRITTLNGGNFESHPNPNDAADVAVRTLLMSDSGARQWNPFPSVGSEGSFGIGDHAPVPPDRAGGMPVEIHVSGSMNNVNLRTTKATSIRVDGDMFNAGLLGQNLQAGDVTSVSVGGRIHYSPIYSFAELKQPIAAVDPLSPGAWDAIFSFLIDPVLAASVQIPANATPSELSALADTVRVVLSDTHALVHGYDPTANPGFIYDPGTGQLGYKFRMSQTIRSALEGPLDIVTRDRFGIPLVKPGDASLGQDPSRNYFATTRVTFAPPSVIEQIYQQSLLAAKDADHISPGFQIGGPGRLDIKAASIDLGSSSGIFSWGVGSANNPVNYETLAGLTPVGASIRVTTLEGPLSMLTSTIASIDGGDLEVVSARGITLSLGDFSLIPPNPTAISYGIFSSGIGNVKVTAAGDINVGGARIASFNGGDVKVRSLEGNVNAGNGANSTLVVPVIFRNEATGNRVSGTIANPKPFGSGILAISPTAEWQAPGASGLPGNITVETPRGSIISTLGGIQQYALNGSIAGGPTITLRAGTPATEGSPAIPGDVDLGNGGVVGGTINISAQGNINGLIVSRQNSNIQAAQNFNGTLLSSGTATVSASGGGISGTVVGLGGVSASGGGPITAALLGQNVSVGGASAQSTLGTSAGATATSQSAAQQSAADPEKKTSLADTASPDENEKKKRAARLPTLTKRVGRVTVILPN